MNITLFWAETRAGAREKKFLWVCLGLSLLIYWGFFTPPLCNICFVHLNNTPDTWWLLHYCTDVLKTTDNPLPFDFQPQQWGMGQILAGGPPEAAEGEDCEASAVPGARWSSPAATLPLLHPELCPRPMAWSGLPRCPAWINSPMLLRKAQISLSAAVPTHR